MLDRIGPANAGSDWTGECRIWPRAQAQNCRNGSIFFKIMMSVKRKSTMTLYELSLGRSDCFITGTRWFVSDVGNRMGRYFIWLDQAKVWLLTSFPELLRSFWISFTQFLNFLVVSSHPGFLTESVLLGCILTIIMVRSHESLVESVHP